MANAKKLSDHDFLELYHKGLMDVEIAEIKGVHVSTVNDRRHRLGLPKNRQHSRNAKRWTVYDGQTGEHIMDGTMREIVEELDVAESTVYAYARYSKRGVPCRYKVHEYEGQDGGKYDGK